MMENAETAHTGHLDHLVALANEAIDDALTKRGGSVFTRREGRPRPVSDELAGALTDPDQMVVVGTYAGYPVGYAVAALEVLHDGSSLGRVRDIYVTPEARQVGVGEVMMDHVVSWCVEHHCVGLDALALPGDRHTKNFFETFGLKARALIVHRSLP